MHKSIPLGLLLSLLSIIGCSRETSESPAADSAQPEVQPPPVISKADSVAIDRGGDRGVHMIGAIKYALGEGGEFTGRPGPAQPAGPVIVYVFMEIPDDYKQLIESHGIPVKSHSAYLLPESAPYNAVGMQQLQYLRPVDPSLSDEQIATEFGVSMTPPAAQPASEGS